MLNNTFDPQVSTCAETDELFYTKYSVPIIRQSNDYYCGPASTLMALIGSGTEGFPYIENSIETNLIQEALAVELSTSPGNGTTVGMITNVMNNYYSNKDGYSYQSLMYGNISGEKNIAILYDISTSLQNDAVPIIRVMNTKHFNYYGGDNYQVHYVVVECVDTLANCITVVDPHYKNEYLGRHIISFEDFFNMTKSNIYFWMSAYVKNKQ